MYEGFADSYLLLKAIIRIALLRVLKDEYLRYLPRLDSYSEHTVLRKH